ncbi:hypothetical protein [Gimesia panareensis]|uniref:hypothetical protein n=1 Tax=Gimesia panareensis TaxID=2527978 RepID=UPI00118A6913|nr:hypothetical protein [Gimesia panareensis]QDU50240.1 hypothetical protein Pan110_25840 [Gimesia panareensis]
MGHSIIEYQGQQLLLRDSKVRCIYEGLLYERDRLGAAELPFNVNRLFDLWESEQNGLFQAPGCIDLELDDWLQGPEDVAACLILVDQLEVHIRGLSSPVSGVFASMKELLAFREIVPFVEPQKIMLPVLKQFRELLQQRPSV